MKIIFTSEGKIYSCEDGNKIEIPCERLAKYKEAISDIRRRKEWKTTGAGAQFTGMAEPQLSEENIYSECVGITPYKDGLIYALMLDSSMNIYSRSLDPREEGEGLIISSNEFAVREIAYSDGKLAFSLESGGEAHAAVLEPPSAAYEELTSGDSRERYVSFSNYYPHRLYFSTSGNGRNENGVTVAHSPQAGAYIDIESLSMNELLADERYDYISLKDDEKGRLYYIRQPYSGKPKTDTMSPTDVLLAPVRILKAFGGWLNFMSVIWGGQSLDGKDPHAMMDQMARGRSRRDIIIDGNVISAKELARKDSDDKPLLSADRVLIRRNGDDEEIVAHGVLDYTIHGDTIIYSDGRSIYSLKDGAKEKLCKAPLAKNISVV